MNAEPVIKKLIEKGGESVLVVGVHTGEESTQFVNAGKKVVGVDILPPYRNNYEHIRGRFEDLFVGKYDIVLSSHVLEHMENVGAVLKKFRDCLKPNGWMGIVVPGYPQDEFFVGHYTLWTPALLLYNLVSNGWDCRGAEFYTTPDRQHIGLVVQNRAIPDEGKKLERDENGMLIPSLKGWDVWEKHKKYLPVEFKHKMNAWLPDRWAQ